MSARGLMLHYVKLHLSFGTKRYYAMLNIINWNIIIIYIHTSPYIVLSFGAKCQTHVKIWERNTRRNINHLCTSKYLMKYCDIIMIFWSERKRERDRVRCISERKRIYTTCCKLHLTKHQFWYIIYCTTIYRCASLIPSQTIIKY